MESKYNIDNFERFLREKTDEFKMYPSKRVWYSIYNNMHPGNRLPSVSMCIILICSLLLIGYLNTDTQKNSALNTTNTNSKTQTASLNSNGGKEAKVNLPVKALPVTGKLSKPMIASISHIKSKLHPKADQSDLSLQSSYTTGMIKPDVNSNRNEKINTVNVPVQNYENQRITNSANSTDAGITVGSNEQVDINTISTANKNSNINLTSNPSETNLTSENIDVTIAATINNSSSQKEKEETNTAITLDKNTNNSIVQVTTGNTTNNNGNSSESNDKEILNAATSNEVSNTGNTSTTLAAADKAWIENYALYNRPAPKKWAGKLSWQSYITPSLVYRKLYNNTAAKAISGNGIGNFNNSNVDNTIIQKPSFGIETGLSLQYDVLKWLKVKAGVQLNYTRYNAHAYENHHPISTSLIMNNSDNSAAYEVFRSTAYSNTVGLNPIKLHNETYQLSLPIGADVRLVNSNNVSWYAGATIQPTFIVFAKSYLVSGDRRNYIKDGSMLNRFNLNAGFETYLSFNTSGYTWQIGPQFRTQLFSTNTKLYSVEERLLNYGVKIGVTKKL